MHFPTTSYARVLLFMFIRRELEEERYRMFISVYTLCFSVLSHVRIYAGELMWIWQVMWIFETPVVARLCDKYHNILLAWLQFAHTNV